MIEGESSVRKHHGEFSTEREKTCNKDPFFRFDIFNHNHNLRWFSPFHCMDNYYHILPQCLLILRGIYHFSVYRIIYHNRPNNISFLS